MNINKLQQMTLPLSGYQWAAVGETALSIASSSAEGMAKSEGGGGGGGGAGIGAAAQGALSGGRDTVGKGEGEKEEDVSENWKDKVGKGIGQAGALGGYLGNSQAMTQDAMSGIGQLFSGEKPEGGYNLMNIFK